jgi:DNA-binding GntR family transcriptional regulator
VNVSARGAGRKSAEASQESLSEQAYGTIRKKLVTLEITPGEFFSESQLAAQLGTSKTPVREALTRLQHEGLVEVESRAGYRATPITLGDARQLLDLRSFLDGEAAALAAAQIRVGRPNEELLRGVEALSKLTYDPDDRASIWRYLETNTQFHIGIAQIGGNKYVVEALVRVYTMCERLLHAGMALTNRQRDVLNDHEEIFKGVLSGDPDRARQVAIHQAKNGRDLILDALLSSSSLLKAWIEVPKQPKT